MKTPAAVCFYMRGEGDVLVVWNKKHGGWVLPGGKVEEGEMIEQAARRELREETGLDAVATALFYSAISEVDPDRMAYVYLVAPFGEPREMEEGSPVTWLPLHELLVVSPFKAFYVKMVAHLEIYGRALKADDSLTPPEVHQAFYREENAFDVVRRAQLYREAVARRSGVLSQKELAQIKCAECGGSGLVNVDDGNPSLGLIPCPDCKKST